MTRPAFACGLMRLHVLAPDTTTSRGYLSGIGASGSLSKSWADVALSFNANALEAALVADPDMLDDAFCQAELDIGGTWTPYGQPFLLAPGSGTVIGSAEGSAREFTPVAVGALKGLLDELIVLPKNCDETSSTLRYACGIEGNRYIGWQSSGYTEDATWHAADEYDPTGNPKAAAPILSLDPSVKFVYRDVSHGDTGGLTLLRIGTFTLTDKVKVKFRVSSDEECKVYLDGGTGANVGGVIIDSTSDEDGWKEIQGWGRKLEPGTYRVSAEFTTVDSVGGDGNDSLAFTCFTIDPDGEPDTFLLRTSSSTMARRQSKNAVRPGMALGEVMRRLLEENSDIGCTGADILLDNRTFTDADDSSSDAWDDGQEWVWPLGTPLSQAFADFSNVADLDLTSAFEFEAWNDRGTNLSATKALTPGADPASAGMNIVEYGYESDPIGPTRFLTLSQDGFDITIGTSAETATRPRFGYLETVSGSIARAAANATAAIAQAGKIQRYYLARVAAVSGQIPGVNFTVCDVISGRNAWNAALDLEVLSIAWTQPSASDAQSVLFTIQLAEA